ASSGRVAWLSSAYAVMVVVALLFSLTALVRLRIRRAKPEPGSIRPPVDSANTLPSWGLNGVAGLLAVTGLAILATGDAGAGAGASAFVVLASVLALAARRLKDRPPDEELEAVHLLASIPVSRGAGAARAGHI